MVIIFRKDVLCMVVSSPLQEIVIMIMDKNERGEEKCVEQTVD